MLVLQPRRLPHPAGGAARGGGAGRRGRAHRRLHDALRGRGQPRHPPALPHRGRAHPAVALGAGAPGRRGGGPGRVPRAPPGDRPGAVAAPPPPAGRAQGPQAGGDVRHAGGGSGGGVPRGMPVPPLRGAALRGEGGASPGRRRAAGGATGPGRREARAGRGDGGRLPGVPSPAPRRSAARARRARSWPGGTGWRCTRCTATSRRATRTARCARARGGRSSSPPTWRRRRSPSKAWGW